MKGSDAKDLGERLEHLSALTEKAPHQQHTSSKLNPTNVKLELSPAWWARPTAEDWQQNLFQSMGASAGAPSSRTIGSGTCSSLWVRLRGRPAGDDWKRNLFQSMGASVGALSGR